MVRAALIGIALAFGALVSAHFGEPARGYTSTPRLLGRSEQGRSISVVRIGDPSGPRVLVFGCIHGNETAGIAIARALEHVRTGANWSSEWRGGGQPWDPYYGGPRPFSERESRIARDLIERIHPRVTIWYHQHMDVVWAFGGSTAAGRTYARLTGMRLYHHHWLPGTSTNWQNHHLPGTAALTVELPAGSLSPSQVQRHVRAVLRLARLLG